MFGKKKQSAASSSGSSLKRTNHTPSIISEDILQDYNQLCINVHTSILPRWRGAAPIQRAIINLDKAIFIKKEYSEAIYNKANLLNEIENYEEAINLYNKATKINPNYYNAYNNQGTAEMNINKDSNAIKSFKKASKKI